MISAPPFYRDEYGIGQARCARSAIAAYGPCAAKEAAVVLDTAPLNDEARAISVRILTGHLPHIRRAQSILRAMGEPA